MASSPSAGFAALEDASSDRGRTTRLQPGSGQSSINSMAASSDSGSESVSCPWKTRQFYNQECSRYFDCPTHTIERRLSIDEQHESPLNESRQAPDRESEDELYSSEAEQDLGVDRLGHLDMTTNPAAQRPEPEPSSSLAGVVESESERSHGAEDAPSQGPPVPTHREPSDAPRSQLTGLAALSIATNDTDSIEPITHQQPGLEESSPVSPLSRHIPTASQSSLSQDHGTERAPQQDTSTLQSPRSHQARSRESPDFMLPRWQPDAEATYCPICHTQFSIFVRKHHCRKCGRVVCNSCSPHRIIIPHQYIVRPPGSEIPIPQSLLLDTLGVGYFDVHGISGGERVRLCNPCVPDPNIAPPQSSTASTPASIGPSYGAHHRSRSSIGDAYGAAIPPSNRYGVVFPLSQSHNNPFRSYVPSRSGTMLPMEHGSSGSYASRNRGSTGSYYSNAEPLAGSSSSPYSRRYRYNSLRDSGSSSRQRNLPPTPAPQIAEEDECPICHRELPSRTLPNFEALRESHVTTCIQTHSTYGSPRHGASTGTLEPQAAPRRTGMYSYSATEKDCIDDAECTICLEEFTVGVPMARLECLCRFHRSCISAWFVNHPGRCPVHQHDGFGF